MSIETKLPNQTEALDASAAVDETKERATPRFDAKTGTILLDIRDETLIDSDEAAQLAAEGFQPKVELHQTVIGFKQGRQIKKAIKARPELADQIAELAETTEWGAQPTGERYRLRKQYEGEDEPRESIIEMVETPGAGGFIAQLNELTGLALEEQPPHVTLYTKGNPQGIGVNTAQDIIDLSQTP